MNRLNKFVILFVLPFFCLLTSVSYAIFDMDSHPVADTGFVTDSSIVTPFIEEFTTKTGYTPSEVLNTAQYKNSSDETQKQLYITTLNACSSAGYHIVTEGNTIIYIFPNSEGFDIGKNSYFCQMLTLDYSFFQLSTKINRNALFPCTIEGYRAVTGSYTFHNSKVKNLSNTYTWDESRGYFFEPTLVNPVGVYYAPGTEPEEPDTPSLPSNAEIAQVVQAFYDSDLYKNNSNFKDFMVVYSFITGYYSIIGTDNHLLQEIYYDGAKPSNENFTYPDTWWRFYNYFGDAQNLFYGWDYWLYSTRKEDDSFSPISYDGVGKINDLFKLKFTNQSIIVYSSYEYKVYEFRPPTEEGGSNSSTVTTIPGDEYTYNENLDPTDSEYSPIQNYIPTNPSQTILGDVDFDEINKTFEENKGILNIENASWLFTANNQFVGYFIGFLSLLIVFLIISRILGG